MNRRLFTLSCLGAVGAAMRSRWLRGAEVSDTEPSTGHFNAPLPTLGGRQFWADELFFHQWHIQRNVLTDHCRLLDGGNIRHAWGTFDECRAKLDQIKLQKQLPPMSGAAVVVLHGLFRSAASMARMARYLHDKGHYSVFNVNYPTTRGSLAEHAAVLDKILRSLEGIETIHLVAHSLGNLVVRCYLGEPANEEPGWVPDPRLGRMVMLGPPNQGAQMAEVFAGVGLFHAMAGASASQLSRGWKELEQTLATPDFEFGILAGGRGTAKGYNPFLGSDNDMVVSVETTRLPGAADFAVLGVLHTLMMDDAKVQEYTLRFLEQGYFVSADERRPIARDEAPRMPVVHAVSNVQGRRAKR